MGTITEATDETFMVDVIEASRQGPVVVDFWAEWCGPCKMLTPTLERVAQETEGVTLVKVNTDENPRVAQAFQIQSIPNVKAFKDGQVFAEFMGVQPEPAVREFFNNLNPSEADLLANQADALLAQGNIQQAAQYYQAALERDPEHGRSAGGLLAILTDVGDLDAAEEIAREFPDDPDVKRLATLIRFARGAEGQDRDALLARVEADAGDLDAQYALGCLDAQDAQWEAALERFLEIVRTDRKFREDGGKAAMLDLFRLLGDEHPLTLEYRSALTMVLF